MNLSDRELTTILAALRWWQISIIRNNHTPPIVEHFYDHTPLDLEEIETLCDNLNTTETSTQLDQLTQHNHPLNDDEIDNQWGYNPWE